MKRGEIWTARIGTKSRPVLVLTRDEVIDVRSLVTVAEITSQIRHNNVEVPLDWEDLGLSAECVVNLDGLHTLRKSECLVFVATVPEATLVRCCRAVTYALGC